MRETSALFPDYSKTKPELLKLLGEFADLIENVSRFAGQVFIWLDDIKPLEQHLAPTLTLYRHAVELLDAIAGLVRRSSTDPAMILLRSLLESLLQLKYLLEDDQENRGMAFLVCHVHRKMDLHRRADENTQIGKIVRERLKADKVLSQVNLQPMRDLAESVQKLEEVVEQEPYVAAEKEYQRVQQERRRGVQSWYQLFDGPNDLFKLAEHLEYAGTYEIFYRQWSEKVHGSDVLSSSLSGDGAGKADIVQINRPDRAQEVTVYAVGLAFDLHRTIIGGLMPERESEYSSWCMANVRETYLDLIKRQDLIKVTV